MLAACMCFKVYWGAANGFLVRVRGWGANGLWHRPAPRVPEIQINQNFGLGGYDLRPAADPRLGPWPDLLPDPLAWRLALPSL